MSKRLEKTEVNRRDFLGMASVYGGVAAILAVLANSLRLIKPRLLPEASSSFTIGLPEKFPTGTREIVPERNVMVVSTEEGIAVVSLVCTHLGCIVQEHEHGFMCPCHGSEFDDSGKNLAGPAPGPLPWLALSLRADGKLLVNSKSNVVPGTFYKA